MNQVITSCAIVQRLLQRIYRQLIYTNMVTAEHKFSDPHVSWSTDFHREKTAQIFFDLYAEMYGRQHAVAVFRALCSVKCTVNWLVVDWIQILGCFSVTSLQLHSMLCILCSRNSHCGCCTDRPIVPHAYFSAHAALYFHSSGLRWKLLWDCSCYV